VKYENISDTIIGNYKVIFHFKFPSGKSFFFIETIMPLTIKPQQSNGTDISKYIDIMKGDKANPDMPTVNEIRVAFRDDTYTLQVIPLMIKRLDINDNFDEEVISILEELQKLRPYFFGKAVNLLSK
jgi:hypothetical protein